MTTRTMRFTPSCTSSSMDDGGARAAHARGLHGDGRALEGAREPEHPAFGVDLARIVEERLGDMARAQRVAGQEDGLGVVAGLGAEMNWHDRATLPARGVVGTAPCVPEARCPIMAEMRLRARSSLLLAGLLLLAPAGARSGRAEADREAGHASRRSSRSSRCTRARPPASSASSEHAVVEHRRRRPPRTRGARRARSARARRSRVRTATCPVKETVVRGRRRWAGAISRASRCRRLRRRSPRRSGSSRRAIA